VTNVFWSDLDVAVHQTAFGSPAPYVELANAWTDWFSVPLGLPIYAGTTNSRNIIAERLLAARDTA